MFRRALNRGARIVRGDVVCRCTEALLLERGAKRGVLRTLELLLPLPRCTFDDRELGDTRKRRGDEVERLVLLRERFTLLRSELDERDRLRDEEDRLEIVGRRRVEELRLRRLMLERWERRLAEECRLTCDR